MYIGEFKKNRNNRTNLIEKWSESKLDELDNTRVLIRGDDHNIHENIEEKKTECVYLATSKLEILRAEWG